MAFAVSGFLNKQTAGKLGISEITVKAHRRNVMRKMHAHSFATLVTLATKLGLTSTSNRDADGFVNRHSTLRSAPTA